jgi:hypothetical protein
MIHMGMGRDDADKRLGSLANEMWVGHLHFVALQGVLKGYSAVHHEPATIMSKQV